MKHKAIISINSGKVRQASQQIHNIDNLNIYNDEQIAITGANGAGKTTLVNILTGACALKESNAITYNFSNNTANNTAYDNIKYIAFHNATTASGEHSTNYFYQQRWNATMIDDSPKVCDILDTHKSISTAYKEKLFALLGIQLIYERRLISLSSGELRKFQITQVLLSAPHILIMDNPFIGLDAQTRDMLQGLLSELAQTNTVQIILVLSKTDDIPNFITHVLEVNNMTCETKCTLKEFLAQNSTKTSEVLSPLHEKSIAQLAPNPAAPQCNTVAELRNVSIRYGKRTILEGLNWNIKLGEKWALSGENGAGKSTLLSLLCADNPQAYACDITLFERRRGSGESIWDIKRHIGYVSPEMHRAYLLPNSALEIVASGLYDTIGVRSKISAEQETTCLFWMKIFGIEDLMHRNFLQLSSGEQRLILVCRAFVKDPTLLILDEPLHGLDMHNRRLVSEIIETFAARKNKSIIYVTHYHNELPPCFTKTLHLKRIKEGND